VFTAEPDSRGAWELKPIGLPAHALHESLNDVPCIDHPSKRERIWLIELKTAPSIVEQKLGILKFVLG
jgi:hypothetical protein